MKRVARLQQEIDMLELQEQELLPVEAKTRQMGHRAREGQIEKLRRGGTGVQRNHYGRPENRAIILRTVAKAIHKKSRNVRRMYRTFRTRSRAWKNTKEGRRASDAGSVQQCNTNNSCCGGAAAAISAVFKDLWNRRTQFPPGTLRGEVRNLQEWCARLNAEVEKEEEPETGGLSTTTAAEGANQVPSPFTPSRIER